MCQHFQVKDWLSPLAHIIFHVTLLNHISVQWPYMAARTPDKPTHTGFAYKGIIQDTNSVNIYSGCSCSCGMLHSFHKKGNSIIRLNDYIPNL